MKLVFAIIIASISVSASAQMGMGMNPGMGRSSTGIRSIDQQHNEQGRAKAPTPEEQLDQTMTMLTTELTLNGLQEAAIRNILHDQQRQLTALRTDTRPDSEKQEDARLITEKSDKDIKALLDPDQLTKYEAFKEQMRSGKKKKSKKDKKKDEVDVHE